MKNVMKYIIATLFSLFLGINSSFALSNNDVPDEFNVTEHWISLTTSFDIETKTQKLGTLYRKFFSLLLTYEFFDPNDIKIATARAKFFSLTAHFDVYDNQDSLLGVAEERLFAFFPTFDIYAKDGSTKLAKARMNFLGTTFTISDPSTDQEIATMHRSFFRLKNDWGFKITNRPLFLQKNIDPRVLMTVIAFQGDREYWEQNQSIKGVSNNAALNSSGEASDVTNQHVRVFLEKINAFTKQKGLINIQIPDQTILEITANELENNYKSTMASDETTQTNQESFNGFIDYCLSQVQSNNVSDSKKKAILYLLKMRLEAGLV